MLGDADIVIAGGMEYEQCAFFIQRICVGEINVVTQYG
jgi:hypothetical protein